MHSHALLPPSLPSTGYHDKLYNDNCKSCTHMFAPCGFLCTGIYFSGNGYVGTRLPRVHRRVCVVPLTNVVYLARQSVTNVTRHNNSGVGENSALPPTIPSALSSAEPTRLFPSPLETCRLRADGRALSLARSQTFIATVSPARSDVRV